MLYLDSTINTLMTSYFFSYPGVVFRCLMSKFGSRFCVMTGGLIAAMGLGLSVFVEELYQLYLTYGLLTGKHNTFIISHYILI